ncbi:hypothetical protein N1851_015918 [Merluccius polli]|uniref:Uncharacterized protein n=1 Tax=Merluccius polli TaxID=89951 RepID=A0AA47NZY0_MERPO|nr:hypothetical protein N1851_015918 [Merluccius polli]
MCLTETWLNNNIPDANIKLTGFSHVRVDRDPSRSGKRKGGGLVLYINNRWCNPGHVTVKDIIYCPDIELLAEAYIAISGDFNHVTLDSTLSAFYQYVKCPTRKNKTIDLMYANVKDAYTATPLPPLGKSDHNLVFLHPQYTPLVCRQKHTMRSFRKWSPECAAGISW